MFTISAFITLAAFGVLALLVRGRLRFHGWAWLVLAAVAVHLGWWATRIDLFQGPIAVGSRLVATIWTVTAVVLVVMGLPWVLVPWVIGRLRRARLPDPVDPGRRRFFGEAAVPLLALGVSATGTVSAFRPFELREEVVRIPELPEALDGFRIGQITDLHVGLFIDPDHVIRAVDAMNAAGVHLQVMTGDLIDDLVVLDETMAALERCNAPHGMLAVLGNHEIWRNEPAIRAAYERTAARGRVRLLVDESLLLEHDGARLRVVGVGYPMIRGGSHRVPPDIRHRLMRASAEKAFTGRTPGEAVLCLSHHPDFFPFAAERGAHLTLAGHTHGGQVAIGRRSLFEGAHDYMLGMYRLGSAYEYVSGGTGHWFPFRLGVPTEVTVLTLRTAMG